MSSVTGFVTLLVSFSIAVERVFAVIGKWWPPLGEPDGDQPKVSYVHLVASFLVGTAVAWLGRNEIASVAPFLDPLGWGAYPVIGFLVSGGSHFWTDILSILQAVKQDRRARAQFSGMRLDALKALEKSKATPAEMLKAAA